MWIASYCHAPTSGAAYPGDPTHAWPGKLWRNTDVEGKSKTKKSIVKSLDLGSAPWTMHDVEAQAM